MSRAVRRTGWGRRPSENKWADALKRAQQIVAGDGFRRIRAVDTEEADRD